MKKLIFLVLLTALTSFAFLAQAADRVVVIPLLSTANVTSIKNVVTVSESGADFTSPAAALTSITDANEGNPYVIYIGPGEYTLTQPLELKANVSIIGAGENVTKLIGAMSYTEGDPQCSSPLVSASISDASLSNLTIHNIGNAGDEGTTAVLIQGSLTMTDMTVIASGSTADNWTVCNMGSVAHIVMKNVTLEATGATGTNVGMYNDTIHLLTMTNVTIKSTGAPTNYGVWNTQLSNPTIRYCNIQGGQDRAIYQESGTIHVFNSSISGGVGNPGGTLTCVHSDNGVDTVLNSSCQ